MKAAGSAVKLRKGDWPKKPDQKVNAYQLENIEKFFKACSPDELLLFQVFLYRQPFWSHRVAARI